MVRQVGQGPTFRLDAIAQGGPAVRNVPGHDLGRSDGEVLVWRVDGQELAPELLHVDGEDRWLDRLVQGLLEAPFRLRRAVHGEAGPGIMEGAEEGQPEDVVEMKVGQQGG